MLAPDATRVDATSWHLAQHCPVTAVLACGFALSPRPLPRCTHTVTPYGACLTPGAECCIRCNSAPLRAGGRVVPELVRVHPSQPGEGGAAADRATQAAVAEGPAGAAQPEGGRAREPVPAPAAPQPPVQGAGGVRAETGDPCPAVLAAGDAGDAAGQVHIIGGQVHDLAGAGAGVGEQPDQRLVAERLELCGRAGPAGGLACLDEGVNFAGGEGLDVGFADRRCGEPEQHVGVCLAFGFHPFGELLQGGLFRPDAGGGGPGGPKVGQE